MCGAALAEALLGPPRLRALLVQRCDDMSDALSTATLRLVGGLLAPHTAAAWEPLVLEGLPFPPAVDVSPSASAASIDALLALVPPELCTAPDAGYREYWADALAAVASTAAAEAAWPARERASAAPAAGSPLLTVLLRRLRRLLDQPYDLNLALTGLLAGMLHVRACV